MKVIELIDILKRLSSDMEIYIASDAEGNSYSPLDKSGIGSMWKSELGDDDELYTLEDVDEEEGYKECIVFYPY